MREAREGYRQFSGGCALGWEENRPGAECRLTKAPVKSRAGPDRVGEVSWAFGDATVFEWVSWVGKFEPVGRTIEVANLEDALLAVGNLPGQFLEICVLALADLDIVLSKVCCNIANCAAVAPSVERIRAGADVVDVKLAIFVGIGGVVEFCP